MVWEELRYETAAPPGAIAASWRALRRVSSSAKVRTQSLPFSQTLDAVEKPLRLRLNGPCRGCSGVNDSQMLLLGHHRAAHL